MISLPEDTTGMIIFDHVTKDSAVMHWRVCLYIWRLR